MSNHLGNVLVTLSDKKRGVQSGTSGSVLYYLPMVKTAQDYYPGGMMMPGRKFGIIGRHGFNGQERTKELGDDFYEALYWEYDSRILRRWNIDPVPKSMVSPYYVLGGNPIMFVDPLGNDWYKHKKSGHMIWFDGSGKQKGYKHMGVNFRVKTDIKGVTVWYGNSKDQEWQQKDLPEIVVTGKVKPKSLMNQSPIWQGFNKSLKEAPEWNAGFLQYNRRLNTNQPLIQIGDNDYYLNHMASYQRHVKAENDWRAMSMGAVGMYIVPFGFMGAAESGAGYYLYQSGIFNPGLNLGRAKLVSGGLNGAADMTSQIIGGKMPWDIQNYNWGSTIGNFFFSNPLFSSLPGAINTKLQQPNSNFLSNWGIGAMGDAFGNIPITGPFRSGAATVLNNFVMPLFGNILSNIASGEYFPKK